MENNRIAHGLQDPEIIRKQVRKSMMKNHLISPRKPTSGSQSPMKITEVQSADSSLRSKTRQRLGIDSSQEREQKDEDIEK